MQGDAGAFASRCVHDRELVFNSFVGGVYALFFPQKFGVDTRWNREQNQEQPTGASRNSLNNRELQVEELVIPTVESLGCTLWGVEFLNQGKYSKLRIYIDRDDGVSVDDCAMVSRHVGDLLDVEEFNNNAYTLEVSSPGMDRILFREAHFVDSVGEQVDVRLNFPFEGRKNFVGVLADVQDETAVVQVDDEEYLLPLENIQRARVIPRFE
jgi:ribosome maturation factor RimP